MTDYYLVPSESLSPAQVDRLRSRATALDWAEADDPQAAPGSDGRRVALTLTPPEDGSAAIDELDLSSKLGLSATGVSRGDGYLALVHSADDGNDMATLFGSPGAGEHVLKLITSSDAPASVDQVIASTGAQLAGAVPVSGAGNSTPSAPVPPSPQPTTDAVQYQSELAPLQAQFWGALADEKIKIATSYFERELAAEPAAAGPGSGTAPANVDPRRRRPRSPPADGEHATNGPHQGRPDARP